MGIFITPKELFREIEGRKKTPEEIEEEKFTNLLKEIVSISSEIDKIRNSGTGNLSCTYQIKDEDGFNDIELLDLDGEGLEIKKINHIEDEFIIYRLDTGSIYNKIINIFGDKKLILKYGKFKRKDGDYPFDHYDENSLEKIQITTSEELQKVVNNFKKRLEEYKQYTKQEKKQKMEKLEKADKFADNPDKILDNIS